MFHWRVWFIVIVVFLLKSSQTEARKRDVIIHGKKLAFTAEKRHRRVLDPSVDDELIVVQRNGSWVNGTVAHLAKGHFLVNLKHYIAEENDQTMSWTSEFKWNPDTVDFPIKVKSLKPLPKGEVLGKNLYVIRTGTHDELIQIVTLPYVLWVDKFFPILVNSQTARDVLLGPSERSSQVCTGCNKVIHIADTHFDKSHASVYDPDHPLPTVGSNIPSSHAKIATIVSAEPGITDFQGPDGPHGAKTVGALVGFYTGISVGMATCARAAFYGFTPANSDSTIDLVTSTDPSQNPNGYLTIYQAVQNAITITGATVGSYSWGAKADGEYTSMDSEWDQLHYDNRKFAGFFASGNDGQTISSTTSTPGTLKNGGSCGASMGGPGNYYTIYPDSAQNPQYYDVHMNADFTSHGPLPSGRLSPLFYAPGVYEVVPFGFAIPVNGHTQCTVSSGSSFATPNVAGKAADIQCGYESRNNGTTPDAALVYATLIAHTEPMNGTVTETPVGFRPVTPARAPTTYGYGLPMWQTDDIGVDVPALFMANQVTKQSYCFMVTKYIPLVQYGMFWTDPAAVPYTSNPLINVLDLLVYVNQELVNTHQDSVNNHHKGQLFELYPGTRLRMLTYEPDFYIQGSELYYGIHINDSSIVRLTSDCSTCMATDLVECDANHYQYCNVTSGLMTSCLSRKDPSQLTAVTNCQGMNWAGITDPITGACTPVTCNLGFVFINGNCHCIPEVTIGNTKCAQDTITMIPIATDQVQAPATSPTESNPFAGLFRNSAQSTPEPPPQWVLLLLLVVLFVFTLI